MLSYLFYLVYINLYLQTDARGYLQCVNELNNLYPNSIYINILPSRLSIGLSDGTTIGTLEDACSVLFVSEINLLSVNKIQNH